MYQDPHIPFETIHAQDIDRIIHLLRQGITVDGTGIKQAIHGKISIDDLSPELQALIAPLDQQTVITADGILDTWTLPSTPLSGSEKAHLNGQRQERSIEYTLIGTSLHFIITPSLGDKIIVDFKTAQALNLFPIGSYAMNQLTLSDMLPSQYSLLVYGLNSGTAFREVAKYDPTSLIQQGPSVTVDPRVTIPVPPTPYAPFYNLMTYTVDVGTEHLWVVGSSLGPNYVSKIRISDMTKIADLELVTDADAQVTSITTDGAFVYAFVKGGAPSPNIVVKIDKVTNAITSFPTGLLTVGDVAMAINLAGYLYVSYSSVNAGAGQVRKYDVTTGNLIETFVFYTPQRIVPVLDKLYVMDILPTTFYTRLHVISATDLATDLIDLPFTCSNMLFDGSDLWMARDVRLLKVNKLGTILQYYDPTALNIQALGLCAGSVWTSYDNSITTTPGITRFFPGLPGV